MAQYPAPALAGQRPPAADNLREVKDLNRLRETVLACLYPNMFNSRVEEEERLFQDWDALVSNPPAAAKGK